MTPIEEIAAAAGVARIWHDIFGSDQVIPEARLARILAALGYPVGSAAEIARSRDQLAGEAATPPAMIVTEAGIGTALPATLPQGDIPALLVCEDGTSRPIALANGRLAAVTEPGYYRLVLGKTELTLAVAPPTCHGIDALGDRHFWGPAVQIPALRGATPTPFGGFGELADAARLFAARGADAMMINPVHALFPGHGAGYSPYSPSSRLFLNTAMADPALLGLPPLAAAPGGALIDWAGALPARHAALRALFATLDAETRARIAADSAAEGPGLRRHAIFDALDTRFRPTGADGWRAWPAAFHDPDGAAVAEFAREEAEEVEFHLFTQWLAREGLSAAQAAARQGGMAIGLIADLAVGVHGAGSDSWSLRGQMLDGLTIGAPPDPLGPQGQNWLLSSFSPRGLRDSGYAPFIAMLRATLARAGGLRIDHAFGLARLWVVPDGQSSAEGAYLSYPFEDMLRLAALESHRAQALIVAEDLGTKPFGFTEAIEAKKMLGMRVLWFERAGDQGFIGPQDYAPMSLAMTGTHDTATVAGWWTGRDLDWAEKLHRFGPGESRADADAHRAWDRGRLWGTIGAGAPCPAVDDPAPVVRAALRHLGHTASRLALAPLEDLLALREQPNLPGTIDDHPNWRRRLDAPLAELLDDPTTAERIETLATARTEAFPGH
ncbi:4-alpha-glucanotransferase [Paenirhodobacter hankyongi]|uniref:4-alpha-glucanotransferase n=1 Tax=Paenirhodobacter hankyongi TaxID=2294033 RepID=A0A421BLX2_9RHOB|nr:4-alpha-glucanotransferase [Sinirhodobacter hankyongi]RLL63942.1 4-alpha-glucanotransferase [Sinirhodobacter hankyongi]